MVLEMYYLFFVLVLPSTTTKSASSLFGAIVDKSQNLIALPNLLKNERGKSLYS
jgi:hypothetical protein